MWLLLLIVLLPIVEIALFVTLGAALGLFWTLAIVIGSAVLGGVVIRNEQRAAEAKLGAAMADRTELSRPAALAAIGIATGFLLIAPGFLTDTLGLLLLIPAVRLLIIARFARGSSAFSVYVAGATGRRSPSFHDDVIEGEIVDPPPEPTDPQPGTPRLPRGGPRGQPGNRSKD